MRVFTQEVLDKYVSNMAKEQKSFIVETKNNSGTIYHGNHKFRFAFKKNKKTELPPYLILNLFSRVQSDVNKYIVSNKLHIERVKQKFPSVYTNTNLWHSLDEGDMFNYLDVSHCFWRISYMHGYISEKLYYEVLAENNLKTYRNMSLSKLISPSKREYYDIGNHLFTIREDRGIYKIIYDNIRYTAYNLAGSICKIHHDNCIGYRTDGLLLLPEAVSKAENYLKSRGYQFKTHKCIKIDNEYFMMNKELKRL